jgi:hypothetical protein
VSVCVCAFLYECVSVCAGVRASVCASVCESLCVCVCVCARVWMGMRVCVDVRVQIYLYP